MRRALWILCIAGLAQAQAPLRQLTTEPGIDSDPAWSPDGSTIVFASERDGSNGFDLWVKPSGGGLAMQITNGISNEYGPSWSPDGETIAFYWAWDANLCTVPAEGGNIATLVGGEGAELNPAWSPDGKRIAFDSNVGGNTDIWIQSIAGGLPQRLTDDLAVDEDPSWSPDGSRLVFVSDRGGTTQLWTLAAGGGEPELVGPEVAIQPVWRPGSESIAYVSLPDYDIRMIAASGGPSVPITDSGEDLDYHPAWSPDGNELAFFRRTTDEADIWIADVASVSVRRISWSELRARY